MKSFASLSTISSIGKSLNDTELKLITNECVAKEFDRSRKIYCVLQLIATLAFGIIYATIPSFIFLAISLVTIMGVSAKYPLFWLELV